MLAMTAVVTRPTTNYWTASLYAGLFTAIIAIATALLFQADILVLWILAFLLIGVGPVLGYQLAAGQLGSDWKPIVGGILGFILLPLGWLLWPLLVGAMSRRHSIGDMYLASITGFFVGLAVFLLAATLMGQNPGWIATGFTLLWAFWGGTCGACMAALERL